MNIFEIVGLTGVVFYLGSYAALQFGLIAGRGYLYAVLNLIASSLVLISLTETFNLSSAIIQVSWILISVIGLTRLFVLNRIIRFDAEEALLLEAIAPGLDNSTARRLLKMGNWVDAPRGAVLAAEGKPVVDLCWIQSGRIAIERSDFHVTEVGPGGLIGEATCLCGTPATATARVVSEARYFRIPSGKLRALAARDPELRSQLQASFTTQLREKLSMSDMRNIEQAAAPAPSTLSVAG